EPGPASDDRAQDGGAMSDEFTPEKLQQAMGTIELLRKQIESLSTQENYSRTVMADFYLAKQGLEAVVKLSKGHETLLPIGGNVMVKAKISAKDKVIVGIGHNVSVEKTPEEGLEWVEERLAEMEKGHSQMVKRLDELEEQLKHVTMYAQRAYMTLQNKE
ncbi:MAG: prefoldin subunit alpha, partial [Candidatus Thermoplasmatota archaeon]|nr:prefoldin subunit alpha [Candidatus Thermoplasmatota archaeon]